MCQSISTVPGFRKIGTSFFPIDRLNELTAEGTIGSAADTHYSFMGAAEPDLIEPRARELAGRLKQDKVDAILLAPV